METGSNVSTLWEVKSKPPFSYQYRELLQHIATLCKYFQI